MAEYLLDLGFNRNDADTAEDLMDNLYKKNASDSWVSQNFASVEFFNSDTIEFRIFDITGDSTTLSCPSSSTYPKLTNWQIEFEPKTGSTIDPANPYQGYTNAIADLTNDLDCSNTSGQSPQSSSWSSNSKFYGSKTFTYDVGTHIENDYLFGVSVTYQSSSSATARVFSFDPEMVVGMGT